jgi:hypothetical protein
MLVAQDRVTGLYHRNRPGGRRGRLVNNGLTADLNEVVPFATLNGLKNSLGWGYHGPNVPYRERHLLPECCKAVKWTSQGGYTNLCEHFKAGQKAKQDAFRAKWRIHRVSVVIAIEDIEY